jgi:hypothetical protein
MFIFIIYFTISLTMMADDNRSRFSRANIYILTILIPFILVLYVYYVNPAARVSSQIFNSTTIGILVALGLSLAIAATIYYISTLKDITSFYVLYGLIIVLIAILIIGFAILSTIFMNQIKQIPGTTGYIIHLILYIPCLVSDYTKYLLSEIGATPLVVYVLFLIEIILLLIYFYGPILWKKALGHNGTIIIKDPQFLNVKQSISDSNLLLVPDETNPIIQSENSAAGALGDTLKSVIPKFYLKNYGLSMWIQINATNVSSDKYIFDYGKGCPSIVYLGHSELWKFLFSNSSTTKSYYTKIPFQKWNFIVFNYQGNYVDLFINGNLEITYPFQENEYPEYNNSDNMTIGDDNGVDGAICNVMFYSKPLEMNQIVQNYNYLILQNPPVNNLL